MSELYEDLNKLRNLRSCEQIFFFLFTARHTHTPRDHSHTEFKHRVHDKTRTSSRTSATLTSDTVRSQHRGDENCDRLWPSHTRTEHLAYACFAVLFPRSMASCFRESRARMAPGMLPACAGHLIRGQNAHASVYSPSIQTGTHSAAGAVCASTSIALLGQTHQSRSSLPLARTSETI